MKDSRVGSGDTRHMSRGMSIIDHSERDGLKGLLTIAGGKLTTYRVMAEDAVDVALGKQAEAVAQYQAAYKALDKDLDYRHLVEFKLNALGAAPETVALVKTTASEK